VYVYLVGKSMI